MTNFCQVPAGCGACGPLGIPRCVALHSRSPLTLFLTVRRPAGRQWEWGLHFACNAFDPFVSGFYLARDRPSTGLHAGHLSTAAYWRPMQPVQCADLDIYGSPHLPQMLHNAEFGLERLMKVPAPSPSCGLESPAGVTSAVFRIQTDILFLQP